MKRPKLALAATAVCLACSLQPEVTVADNTAAGDANSICRRDPTRPGCEAPVTGGPSQVRAPSSRYAAASRQGFCVIDPTRPACEASAGRTPDSVSPSDSLRMQKSVVAGAAVGGVGGAIVGLASCGPFLFGGPPAYGLCAATGMLFGLLGGGVAGGVADGIANFDSRSKVNSEPALRPNPGEQATNYEPVASNGPTFEETRSRTDREPENNAIAVAIDARQWAWGTASFAATEDQAKALALHRCQEQAGLKGVANPCAIYSVNGQPIYFDLK